MFELILTSSRADRTYVEDLSSTLEARQYQDEELALQLRDSVSLLNNHHGITLLDRTPGIRLLQGKALAASLWALILAWNNQKRPQSDEASIDGLHRVAERFERIAL